jgi:phenylpyruvate tautomerase PptA (4-oxalocrotonate tautomerase family)
MPIYQCYSPQGLLTKSAKADIAEEITSIHCNATGAPPSLVNVLFRELPEGVFGIIRHGRVVCEKTVHDVTYDLVRSPGLTTVFGHAGSTEQTFLQHFPDDFTDALVSVFTAEGKAAR